MTDDLRTYLAKTQAAEMARSTREAICRSVEHAYLDVINRYVAPGLYDEARRHLEREIARIREAA